MARKLTQKQQLFAAAYDGNGTAACKIAGYKGSDNALAQQARENLRNPQIAAVIEARQQARVQRVEFAADDVLRELKRISLSDIGQAFGKDGKLLPLHEMPEDVRRAISGVEYEDIFEGRGEEREKVGVLVKVKFWDKTRGLELSGKHFKLYTDKVEHSADSSFAEALKNARERAQRR